jgi:hypothetical protein
MNQASLGLISLTFWCMLDVAYADVSEQRKSELLLAIGNDRNERVDNLPTDEKKWLLEYIRNQRKVPGWAGAYELQLIQLGDEEAMARCVGGFDVSPSGAFLLPDSRQPRLIERMAPTMFHDEPDSLPQTGDVTLYPRSISAAALVAHVLSTSNEIPDAVRRWAAETLKATDRQPDIDGKMRSAMRLWWKDNETAMRTRNWAAVKPGIAIVGAAKSVPPLLETPTPEPRAPAESNSPKATSQQLPANGVEASSRSSSWIYCIIAVAVVLIVGLIIALRIQRTRNRRREGTRDR